MGVSGLAEESGRAECVTTPTLPSPKGEESGGPFSSKGEESGGPFSFKGEESGGPFSPKGEEPEGPPPQGEGVLGIVFSASAPNSPGVWTELLTQRLAAAWRKPHPNEYRTRAFVGYATGSTEAVVACEPGAYACAVRFVRAATGQASPLLPLGVVVVG